MCTCAATDKPVSLRSFPSAFGVYRVERSVSLSGWVKAGVGISAVSVTIHYNKQKVSASIFSRREPGVPRKEKHDQPSFCSDSALPGGGGGCRQQSHQIKHWAGGAIHLSPTNVSWFMWKPNAHILLQAVGGPNASTQIHPC